MRDGSSIDFELARVLLVDDDPASRLTLKTVLEAGGYNVDAAASAPEAYDKLDGRSYELVLSDLQLDSADAGHRVLSYARTKDYRPATAMVTTYRTRAIENGGGSCLIESEDIPELLTKVAGLISERAQRRLQREMKMAGIA